jgi:hypothetical protein
MSIGLLILILLIVFFVGGVAPWGPAQPGPPVTGQPANRFGQPWHGYGYGVAVPGGLGLIVLILVVLLLLGRV